MSTNQTSSISSGSNSRSISIKTTAYDMPKEKNSTVSTSKAIETTSEGFFSINRDLNNHFIKKLEQAGATIDSVCKKYAREQAEKWEKEIVRDNPRTKKSNEKGNWEDWETALNTMGWTSADQYLTTVSSVSESKRKNLLRNYMSPFDKGKVQSVRDWETDKIMEEVIEFHKINEGNRKGFLETIKSVFGFSNKKQKDTTSRGHKDSFFEDFSTVNTTNSDNRNSNNKSELETSSKCHNTSSNGRKSTSTMSQGKKQESIGINETTLLDDKTEDFEVFVNDLI